MKRENYYFILCLSLAGLILLHSPFAHADSSIAPQDTAEQVNRLGSALDQIPQTPEQIRDQYLTQEWSSLITKNTVFGPVHLFFLSNQGFFRVVFAQPYSLSVTFFLGIFLWIAILIFAIKLASVFLPSKGWLSFVIGIAGTIVFAQLGLILLASTMLTTFLLSDSAWWMRLIVSVAILVAFFLVYYSESLLERYVSQNKRLSNERKSLEKSEQTRKELDAFKKGFKEGES